MGEYFAVLVRFALCPLSVVRGPFCTLYSEFRPCSVPYFDRVREDKATRKKPSTKFTRAPHYGQRTTDNGQRTRGMFDSPEQQNRIQLIITLLAKLYIVLELSPDGCPICRKTLTHDEECPILLAWSLLDAQQQHEARATIRTLALSIGCDEAVADPVTH